MSLATATALLTTASALTLGMATPQEPARPTAWLLDLATGEAAGVSLTGGVARLDPAKAFLAPADGVALPTGKPIPTGLLTLRPQRLGAPTNRVGSTVRGHVPAGSSASVDVRGLRSSGSWTEWVPAAATPDGSVVTLPEPVSQVQGRLVLTGAADAAPTVTDVSLAAHPATASAPAAEAVARASLRYRVFATREGLVGGTTANGHVITRRDHFVALPSRRALSPRGTGDYSVQVCANGRCAFAPVWDVGPWNTRDDYWNPPSRRQEWRDLPQGKPQAQAARLDGYNGGRDQYGRRVANPAGIDLGDGVFWDALKLADNSWVTVTYLWTGSARLSKVVGNVSMRSAPRATAPVIGMAANRAGVPVACAVGSGANRWFQVGVGKYLRASAVPGAGPVRACADRPLAAAASGPAALAPVTGAQAAAGGAG